MMNCSKARTLALGAATLLSLAISGCGGSGTSTTTIPVTAVTVSYGHSVAFSDHTTVSTWGYNGSGQLGNGYTSTDYTVQYPQENSQRIKASGTAIGEAHTLIFFNNSTVHAWGSNFFGELGNNSTASGVLTPVSVMYRVSPNSTTDLSVAPLKGAKAVAAGSEFSLALLSDGTVRSWGLNDSGQLGNQYPRSSPTAINVFASDGTNLSGVKAISAGAAHSLALKQDGTVWSWGNNNSGQLGFNSYSSAGTVARPVLKSDGSRLTDITMIAAGGSSSYAVDTTNQIWVWGYNGFGQLGMNPASTLTIAFPQKMVDANGTVNAGITGQITAISAGLGHLLVLTTDGLWGVGFNFYGQLGQPNNFSDLFTPVKVANLTGTFDSLLTVDGRQPIVAVGRHSIVRTSTGLWTWGDDTFGQLGFTPGTPPYQATPHQVITQ